jgi:hypothetical protein
VSSARPRGALRRAGGRGEPPGEHSGEEAGERESDDDGGVHIVRMPEASDIAVAALRTRRSGADRLRPTRSRDRDLRHAHAEQHRELDDVGCPARRAASIMMCAHASASAVASWCAKVEEAGGGGDEAAGRSEVVRLARDLQAAGVAVGRARGIRRLAGAAEHPMSKPALCATSTSSPMKAHRSSSCAVHVGAFSTSLERMPWMPTFSSKNGRAPAAA